MACGDEGIAAIVARPGEDQQRGPLQPTQRRRQIGSGQAGALHQRLLGSRSLDRPQLGCTIERF